MSSLDVPGLDVSSRVRARDIQMAAVADVRRRVIMVSGAVDTPGHSISASINLPEAGRWQVIKSETNLTDQTWAAVEVTTDEDSHLVNDPDTMTIARQYSKSFMTPDMRRITFYDGEVRPGESLLKVYSMETSSRRPMYMYKYSPAGDSAQDAEKLMADGLPEQPVVELIIPVTIIG
jgi:hypothetical protein